MENEDNIADYIIKENLSKERAELIMDPRGEIWLVDVLKTRWKGTRSIPAVAGLSKSYGLAFPADFSMRPV